MNNSCYRHWPAILAYVFFQMIITCESLARNQKERAATWLSPDKSVAVSFERLEDQDGLYGLWNKSSGRTIPLGADYGADHEPFKVKWTVDSALVWIATGREPGDPTWLLCHRQDLSTGVHFLEEPKLPDIKRVIIQYADESPEALLIGHPERVKAFVDPNSLLIPAKLEMKPLELPDKRGWFKVEFLGQGAGGRLEKWPHYRLWLSSPDRVRFRVEKIVRVENYFTNMVRQRKDGTIYDRSKSVGRPDPAIRLTERLPQSPNGKWHVCQQVLPPRKDGKVALFLGIANEPEKAIPILPEEVFENPALQWAKNSCAVLLTEGPPDNRLTRLLVLRKDAVSGTIYMDEPRHPIQPWLDLKMNFEPDAFPRTNMDGQGRPGNFRMNMLAFLKPDTYDADGQGGLIDKNLGVIYELQAAERDPQSGMMKVTAAAPIYRVTLHSPDWMRFAFREVVKIQAGKETVLYKNDGAVPK